MPETDLALISHLMRRAGFGSTRAEQEELASKDYDEIVEDLLNPDRFEDLNEDALKRYNLELTYNDTLPLWSGKWVWRMINTKRPLEEKMSLFWHHIFAAAWYKSEHTNSMIQQIQLFRDTGMSDMRTILLGLSKDPAMNYWLDNCENHSGQPNENWGRELLELFSMGVGNYTEDDIKNAARAFTGWTFTQPPPLYPFGSHESKFHYVPEDHDDSEKTFLGNTGALNGEDIIDIIVKHPATARFIARHLYNFFVADEPQVPAWDIEPPNDPEAIDILVKAFQDNDGQIVPVLRALFTSDFFKNTRQQKVKNPAELVVGTIKLVGTYQFPEAAETMGSLSGAASVMGQALMNPPTVEGWHTGHEWIDGGTLNERVNFAVNQFSDISKPGIQDILSRLEGKLSPENLVDRCLELVGPFEIGEATRSALTRHANNIGELDLNSDEAREENADKIGRILQLIVASREYQFA
jgi:uncharacterized protein (DUF1800 family)